MGIFFQDEYKRGFMMDKLEMIVFDVGLGDCIFCSCGGMNLLVDGGKHCPDSLKKYIKDRKIELLDYIICTHGHDDHVDGLAEIMGSVEFGVVFCNTDTLPSKEGFNKMLSIVENKGKKIEIPCVNDCFKLGEAHVEFLSPEEKERYHNGNDCSLVIRVSFKRHSILLMADAGEEVMNDMLKSHINIKSDIIKIPHHGLENISEKFLKKVEAKFGIISYGKNHYGSISKELIDNLNDRNMKLFRTDECGDIYFAIDDMNITVRSIR